MSRINPGASEQSNSPLPNAIEPTVQAVLHAGAPMLFAGVNRRINTGNYENIDIYCAVSIPIMMMPDGDVEAFRQAVAEAADLGFAITSQETAIRFSKIREMQKGRQT